jgi:hypothetical protein
MNLGSTMSSTCPETQAGQYLSQSCVFTFLQLRESYGGQPIQTRFWLEQGSSENRDRQDDRRTGDRGEPGTDGTFTSFWDRNEKSFKTTSSAPAKTCQTRVGEFRGPVDRSTVALICGVIVLVGFTPFFWTPVTFP